MITAQMNADFFAKNTDEVAIARAAADRQRARLQQQQAAAEVNQYQDHAYRRRLAERNYLVKLLICRSLRLTPNKVKSNWPLLVGGKNLTVAFKREQQARQQQQAALQARHQQTLARLRYQRSMQRELRRFQRKKR